MPGKIKVKVLAGRNLPVMDRASETTDAFVEIKFGSVTHKTDVCRKSLNPHWNSTEWYRFEVDESELQDEPLQLRLMDHDTYSANDAIGKVVISLAPLLAREANNVKNTAAPHGGAVMSGWIPVFDTMHGIRGELNVIVKVELFSDFNKYKTSSCGVQFFHCPSIPPGYRATAIHGFVEELVVNDDPEYQWIDKIRTPRASNEARQVAFIKLSNQVQRLVGLKAAELGANAVVGYQQDFDLEGETGVVARAIGTAVSIAPLPTPSQPINVPPCTQQQLKKYLDILANDNENIIDLSQYYQTHQEELQKMISILNPNASSLLDESDILDDDEKSMDMTRQTSITNSYIGGISLYQDDYVSQKSLRHLSEDQIDLNRLLNREGDDSDSSGTLQKIKKIKNHFFSKKFTKTKKTPQSQDDQISLKSTSSDNSRISIYDIKNEIKKLKIKKPKFRNLFVNKEDEGEGMASILARSVIHARTSLHAIAEKDSEQSPTSTMRRTSESEPTINISDDEKNRLDNATKTTSNKVPEIRFTSLSNINVDTDEIPKRKISESCPATPIAVRTENQLKLPGEEGYFDSVSSALSGESSDIYSSSEEDDESSDLKTDTEKSIETTTSVVQSVLSHEVNPVLIAQMEEKLGIVEYIGSDDSDINQKHINNDDKNQSFIKENKSDTNLNELQIIKENIVSIEKCKSLESVPRMVESNKNVKEHPVKSSEVSTSSVKEDVSVSKSNTHHIKFHNPFAHKKVSKSISAPSSPVEKSSFVYRSSKRIKRQLSKLSKNNMIKSISHYSLRPKKETKAPLSHPGSSTDIHSKAPSDTVLGTPFMSYTDLLGLDRESNKSFHRSNDGQKGKVSMYIGSEPVSRASFSGVSSLNFGREEPQDEHKKHGLKASGLIHTAMETILLDKVQNLLIPTSPDCHSAETKQFFNDVNEKLEIVEKTRNIPYTELHSDSRSETGSLSPTISSVSSYNKPAFQIETKGKEKSPTLVQTAMETILMDKVQSILIPTTPETPHPEILFDYVKNTRENSGVKRSLSIQAQSSPKTLEAKSPSASDKHFPFINFERHIKPHKQEIKPSGLIQTAMETMLMEKVQSVLGPQTPEPVITKVFFDEQSDQPAGSMKEGNDGTGLIQTAINTLLIDKAQVSLLGSELPEPVIGQPCTEDKDKMTTKLNKDILGKPEDALKSPGLIQLAVQTMLLEKAQALVPPESLITEPEQNEAITKESNMHITPKEIVQTSVGLTEIESKSMGLIETAAIQDQGNSSTEKNNGKSITNPETDVLNASSDVHNLISQSKNSNDRNDDRDIIKKRNEESIENSGLVGSAIQTILLDKVQSLMPDNTISIATDNSNESKANEDKRDLINTALETILFDEAASPLPPVDVESNRLEKDTRIDQATEIESRGKYSKKLTRQDSVHSINESEMSKSRIIAPCITKTPVLQHFHPILSGAPLETIPSLPESSLDHSESIDSDTNKASVCGNLHAAWDADRSDRDKESRSEKDRGSPRHARHESYGGTEPQTAHAQNSSLNASSTPLGIHRRSSDSDLSVTPKGGSLNTSAGNVGSGGGAILRPSMNSNNLDMLEYPFLTMSEYPPGFIVHIGGTVCARSVKLVEGEGGAGGAGARAAWWAELRTELRAHARALRCHAVIAYADSAAMCEDVCVLSASGTAAVINLDCDFNAEYDVNGSKSALEEIEAESCSVAHVPYSPGSGPYRAELASCGGCRRARVPSVLLATCAKPNRLAAHSKAITLTAVAARVRRAPPTSEPGARDISDQLPFLEYELHKLLLAKLRMQGANALFSLQTQIAVGERCVMALASGTAFRLTALPPPAPPRIKASENDKDALEIQKALWDTFKANTIANGFEIGNQELQSNGVLQETENDDAPVLDLCADKDACVLELDEAEDVETARSLATRQVNMQVFTPGLKPALGAAPLAFAQVWRGRLSLGGQGAAVSTTGEKQVRRALSGAAYKLRRLQPAALVAPTFQLDLPDDEIQLVVSGTAIPLQDPSKPQTNGSSDTHALHANPAGDADDDIFALDEEQLVKSQPVENEDKNVLNGQVPTAVSLTSLSFISGARLVRRLCALRLLFVRETTAVRELGGLSGFLHTFTCEVLAIVRAYTAALGGNALTSFYITQLMLQDNAHKNQGQCLLSVGGDVVHITY